MNEIGFMVSGPQLVEDGVHIDTWRITIDATLPRVREGMPERLKESLTRVRLMALTGECPCGGFALWRKEEFRQRHESDCPGGDVMELLRRWFEEGR